jgi:hypothetical protein
LRVQKLDIDEVQRWDFGSQQAFWLRRHAEKMSEGKRAIGTRPYTDTGLGQAFGLPGKSKVMFQSWLDVFEVSGDSEAMPIGTVGLKDASNLSANE